MTLALSAGVGIGGTSLVVVVALLEEGPTQARQTGVRVEKTKGLVRK